MFNRRFLQTAFTAALLGAGVEASWQLARNLPVLRAPAWRTAVADALVAWAVTVALFWLYAALLRGLRLPRDEKAVPTAAAYAAISAPLLWYAIYRAIPVARLSWLVALVAGASAAPFAAASLAYVLRRRRVATVMAATAALILLVVTASTVLEQTRPGEPGRANFLLITLDTTRADRLGCYGYPKARTPTLDRLAARGAKFERALCLEPLTAPSHATIMTSLYPETAGVLLNAMRLRGDVPTLAEKFRDAGYATAAFVASSTVQARNTALDRGFEHYDDAVTPREGYHASPLIPLAFAEKLSMLALDENCGERRADEVTEAAIRWLKQPRRRPFFIWLHYFDPHDDYLPPARYVRPGLGSRSLQKRINENWAKDKGGPKLPKRIAALYDGEIAFMDAEIGRFLGELERRALAPRTLVLIVGDHGEAFGEHGTKYHGFRLYDEEIKVPFVVCDLGGSLPRLPEPALQVTTLDVAPTTLDLAGLAVPRTMRGRPLFRNADATPAYCIRVPDPLRKNRDAVGRLDALATPEEKIILRAEGSAEYYDLAEDPGETNDLARERPARVAELRVALEAVRAGVEPSPPPARELDSETMDKLRALGYIK
ncbi:MAG: sulfatase-like hydrolase/transferase [candidate division Zixibacteria bacterium]|nr:sulfatase-like hydrolase/transferase [candidate division Zixibacteria bacterium]